MTETTPLPDAALTALDLTAPVQVNAGGVTPLDTPRGKVWVKTVEPETKRIRRAFLSGLGRVLPIPILRPSKAGKGGDTLSQQAEQIETLRAAGLPVPETLYADRDFLIIADAGPTLDAAVKYDDIRARMGVSEADLHAAILTMTETLTAMHANGFAHGRPKIRDFAWKDGQATILDLEERPWEVMSMPAAQARDIFLWIIDLCSFPLSRPVARPAMTILTRDMNVETCAELRKLLRLLAIASPPVRLLAKTPLTNREIIGSLAAYDTLKAGLRA